LDARAGRPTGRRPTGRPRLAGRRARGRLPLGVAGLRPRQAGGCARRDHARAERRGPRAGGLRGRRVGTRTPPRRRTLRTDGRPGHGPGVLHRGGRRPPRARSRGRDRRRRAGATGAGPLGRHPVTDGPSGTAIVTGPTVGGIGYFVALGLARGGRRVVLAGRTPERLAAASDAIRREVPDADLERLVVDVSVLDSVRSAA